MTALRYDYGRVGILGIGTPQANPTVEAEMRVLLPPNVLLAVARLTSVQSTSQARLKEYLEGLESTLAQYGSLRPSAFGFACTASSYLMDPGREHAIVAGLEDSCGFPIITATSAIDWYLRRRGIRRIALASPYPEALTNAAERYWQAAGYEVAQVQRIETGSLDTRSIYALGSIDAQAVAVHLARLEVDAVLLSGTGMPSLPLLVEPGDGPMLLSSNLCLAARLCSTIGLPEPDPVEWGPRLALATATAAEGTFHR